MTTRIVRTATQISVHFSAPFMGQQGFTFTPATEAMGGVVDPDACYFQPLLAQADDYLTTYAEARVADALGADALASVLYDRAAELAVCA